MQINKTDNKKLPTQQFMIALHMTWVSGRAQPGPTTISKIKDILKDHSLPVFYGFASNKWFVWSF